MGITHSTRRSLQFRFIAVKQRLAQMGFTRFQRFAISKKTDAEEDKFVHQLKTLFAAEQLSIDIEIALTEQRIAHVLKTIMSSMAIVEELDELEIKEVGALQTKQKELEGSLRTLQQKKRQCSVPADTLLRLQYREIMATPRLRSLQIIEERLVFETDTLYGRDHNNKWRRIGQFRISFDLLTPSLKTFHWVNLDGVRTGPRVNQFDTKPRVIDTFHGPPNIVEGVGGIGYVSCAGTEAASFISDAVRDRDFTTLVAFSVRYPECAGTESQRTIELWPLAHEDEIPEWYRVCIH